MADADNQAAGAGLMVRAQGIHKRYGRDEVLKGIDIDVAPGEVLCLIGPSGSGKSTFLRCINHLEKIDAGRLWVDGELIGYRERGRYLYEMPERDVSRQRAGIGMVFQRFNLFPHMTVLENIIEAPVHVRREPRARVAARARGLGRRGGLAGWGLGGGVLFFVGCFGGGGRPPPLGRGRGARPPPPPPPQTRQQGKKKQKKKKK
jgi:polar amino acid transport system ATP-binding protein